MRSESKVIPSVRIRMKVGEHHFHGEGPGEEVRAHLREFSRLIGKEEPPVTPTPPPEPPPVREEPALPPIHVVAIANGNHLKLAARSGSAAKDVLVLMLAHRELRQAQMVTGAEIMHGLRSTGHNVGRADYILKRHAAAANILISGRYRLKRYRLTTDGALRAQETAQHLANFLKSRSTVDTPSPAAATGAGNP